MDAVLRELPLALSDTGRIVGHFTYFLLVLSMLMRSMAWLRGIAVVAGIAKIIYRSVFVFDPISILWESVFVLVNLGQLIVLWWMNRPPRVTEEEKYMLDTLAPHLPPAAARALLARVEWREAAAGTHLTDEGKAVGGLLFVSAGDVDVVVAGRTVAQCSRGDFIGEMTWEEGNPATATAVARSGVRYAWFEREGLRKVLGRVNLLRYALSASFSRNLIQKIARRNKAAIEAAPVT